MAALILRLAKYSCTKYELYVHYMEEAVVVSLYGTWLGDDEVLWILARKTDRKKYTSNFIKISN